MNLNKHTLPCVSSLTVLAAIGLAGCHNTGPRSADFFPQDEARSVDVALERQKTVGAQQDATLRDQHFDGSRLNSLGRSKLDRMLSQPGPVTVYLSGTGTSDRHQAIVAYAADRGRPEADVRIIDGLNPASLHPAAPELARLNKTELGSAEDAATQNDPAPANDSNLFGTPATGASNTPAKHGG